MSRIGILIGCVILFAGLACAAYDDVLGIKVLTPPENGCRKAKDGDVLKMHYEGKLENGDSAFFICLGLSLPEKQSSIGEHDAHVNI
jgi:hypothetical protein